MTDKAVEFGVYVKTDKGEYYPMQSVQLPDDLGSQIDRLFDSLKELGGTDLMKRIEIMSSREMFKCSVILQLTFNTLSHELERQKLIDFEVPLNS